MWQTLYLQPAVAVGNVGQLGVDLLISTLQAEHIGYLQNSSVLPMVGADPFNLDSTKLVTSWEVYECKKNKLIIVQQRSPIAPGKSKEYKRCLIEWIQTHQFKTVILMSSCFSQFFTVEDLQGAPMLYLCTSKVKPNVEDNLKQLHWKEFDLGTRSNPSGALSIPGGGITKTFFEDCNQVDIPLVVMILVCSEGNNYPEAILMADALEGWLRLTKPDSVDSKWKLPVSWSLPFGNEPPPNIY